jgi:WD40 repeat protein/serine/threonine protein kinase
LVAFTQGNLPLDVLDAIAEHLGSCASCESAIQQEEGPGDVLLSSLRRLAGSGTDEDAILESEMAALVACGFNFPPPHRADIPRPKQLREYQLLETLGEGGMGTVFRALHTRLDKTVALKTLAAWRMDKPDAVARFHREMKAVGNLSHPNIVQATDAGEVEGTHFLVMEFVEGLDLSKLVKRLGPLPVSDACELIRQAAVRLEYVHQHGLVHRDVKPSNLLLSHSGQVKVLDLGLARLGETLTGDEYSTASSMVMGSFDYMAPEQADDPHAADARADLYSLGCTLYFLLVGEPPFPAPRYRTALQKVKAHAAAAAPRVQDQHPETPAELAQIVERLLSKQPADRFDSAADLAVALEKFSRGSDLTLLFSAPAASARDSADTAPPTAVTRMVGRKKAGRQLKPQAPSGGRGGRRWPWVAGGALLAALLGVMILYIRTDEGTIEIVSDDREVKVIVERGGEQVRLIDLATNQEVELRSGKYHLRIEGREDLELVASDFDLRRGDKVVASIRRKAASRSSPEPVVARLDNRPSAADALRRETIPPLMLAAAGGGNAQNAPHSLVGVFGRRAFWCGRSQGSVSFSPDGKRLACAVFDHNDEAAPGEVRVFDVETGEELMSLPGHTAAAFDVQFSPDGERLASCGAKTVTIWNARTGEEIRSLTGFAHRVASVAFSPDGRRLATGGGAYREAAELKVWDLETGQEVLSLVGHTNFVASVAFSQDGTKLASAAWDNQAKIWDAEKGEELRSLSHGYWVNGVAFSPDGARLATASYDYQTRIWNVESGELEHTLPHPWCVTDVAFSSDGEFLATGGFDQKVRVYDTRAFTRSLIFDGQCSRVSRVAFSSNGKLLALAGVKNSVQVWNVEAKTWLFSQPHRSETTCVAVSSDGRTAASGGNDQLVRVWDLATPQELRTLIDEDYFQGGVSRVRSLAHQGSLLVSAHENGMAKVWDPATGVLRHKLIVSSKSPVLAAVLQADGVLLATGDADGLVKLWDPRTGAHLRTLRGHASPVHALALSEDALTLASGSEDGAVHLWDPATGADLRNLSNDGPVRSLAFVADDQWLAVASDSSIKVCDVATGETLHALSGHQGSVRMAYHPAGKMLAACGAGDRSIRVWDVAHDPPQPRVLSPYASGLRVESLAFTPEGRYLITGNSDGTLYALQLAPPPAEAPAQ